jgi:hypothetical protein
MPDELPGPTDDILDTESYNNAVTGLQYIANIEAWWGDELDAQEAVALYLYLEFGILFEEYGGELPQTVIDVVTNRYYNNCSEGPWSVSCINGFWAYSQAIREPTAANSKIGNVTDSIDPYFVKLAGDIVNYNITPSSRDPVHWANNSDPQTAQFLYEDALSVQLYAYWVYASRDELGNIYSVFAIQTYSQYVNTCTGLVDWRVGQACK